MPTGGSSGWRLGRTSRSAGRGSGAGTPWRRGPSPCRAAVRRPERHRRDGGRPVAAARGGSAGHAGAPACLAPCGFGSDTSGTLSGSPVRPHQSSVARRQASSRRMVATEAPSRCRWRIVRSIQALLSGSASGCGAPSGPGRSDDCRIDCRVDCRVGSRSAPEVSSRFPCRFRVSARAVPPGGDGPQRNRASDRPRRRIASIPSCGLADRQRGLPVRGQRQRRRRRFLLTARRTCRARTPSSAAARPRRFGLPVRAATLPRQPVRPVPAGTGRRPPCGNPASGDAQGPGSRGNRAGAARRPQHGCARRPDGSARCGPSVRRGIFSSDCSSTGIDGMFPFRHGNGGLAEAGRSRTASRHGGRAPGRRADGLAAGPRLRSCGLDREGGNAFTAGELGRRRRCERGERGTAGRRHAGREARRGRSRPVGRTAPAAHRRGGQRVETVRPRGRRTGAGRRARARRPHGRRRSDPGEPPHRNRVCPATRPHRRRGSPRPGVGPARFWARATGPRPRRWSCRASTACSGGRS